MLKLALFVLLGLDCRAVLTITAVRMAPAPVPALGTAPLLASPRVGPSAIQPLLTAPLPAPAISAMTPVPVAAPLVAPVPALVPAVEALAAPEPAALPAALGKVFDGSSASPASFAPDFAASGRTSALGQVSAAGEEAFLRYAAKGQTAAARPAVLEPGSWLPENQARLERLIKEHGRGSARYDPEHPPLATFDWDNTMIRHDIGEAVFYRAIKELAFKFDRGDEFWDLIPKEFGRDELRDSYQAIARAPLAQARQTPEYRRYRKLFHQVYEQVKRQGHDYGLDYGWLVQLMLGYSQEELERFADETIAEELAKPLGEETISGFDGDPNPVKIASGIRPHKEMFDLARRLQEAGWEVRIISATAEWIVARFAVKAGIPPGRVHGVRAAVRNGRLTTRLTQRTWGQGKADAILRRAGRPSLLAGGDSNSDLQMLELSQGERLVVDFGREPLRTQARERGWLVQPPFQP